MNLIQAIRFALGGLWRQKVRTALTLVGVAVGTAALVFSLSLGIGLRAFIDREFRERDAFWRVTVRVADPTPDPEKVPPEKVEVTGAIDPERRARLREALARRYLRDELRTPPKPLDKAAVAALEALPDVSEVRIVRSSNGRAWLADRSAPAFVVSAKLDSLTPRLIAGTLPVDDSGVVLSELALYDLGVRDDAALDAALGAPVQVDVGGTTIAPQFALARALAGWLPTDDLSRAQATALARLAVALPKSIDKLDLDPADRDALRGLLDRKSDPTRTNRPDSGKVASGQFKLAGVVRLLTEAERKKADPFAGWELAESDAYLTPAGGETVLDQLPWVKNTGVHSVEVRVRPGGDMPAVVAAAEEMGFGTFSALRWYSAAKREVTLVAGGLNLFALIGLLVAGVGITNTLVTSVVERTREIGILKAVGATRGQVTGLFLTEGAAIGLTGGLLGLAAAVAISYPADGYVRGLIRGQMGNHEMKTTTIFEFPWWLLVGGVVFAVLITTLAALYPARRAARIDPILALKYE
ncbi:FtsX-like permease family protein [bacterium]|nr:FtsX-like permease family protein [bacterium]